MTFDLEDGVPIPEINRSGAGRKAKYPWEHMAPGQSFFAAGISPRKLVSSGYGFFSRRGRKVKLCCRAEKGGARIWLIS